MRLIEHELIEPVQGFFEKAAENGLERREGQIAMSSEICDAVVKKKPIAVEAEVGIGKSIAYLVPVILQYFRERRQIIIATSTIALQEQLENDVHTVLRMIGVKAEIIAAYGMRNYICRRRLAFQERKNSAAVSRIAYIAQHGEQLKTKMGIEINDKLWDSICIKSIGERCRDCRYAHNCQYSQMRSRLQYENGIVICNQNMLVAHLIQKDKGLPGIFDSSNNITVIDEAHNLESKFRDAYTRRMSQSEFRYELTVTEKRLKNTQPIDALRKMYAELFKSLHNDIAIQKRNAEGDMLIFYFNQGEYVKKLLFNIRRGLADLEKKLGYELNSLAFLRDLCNIRNESIIWLESDVELTFCICRKDICRDISRLLFKRDVCTVLTSATISSSSVGKPAERCRYFLEALDFPTGKGIISEPKSSPFDYDKNTMLYVSPDMPYPGHCKEERRQYADAAISEIIKLLAVTDGKALILFTAKSDMTYVYGRLTNEKPPYKLLIQNDSSSQKRRLEKFRADTNSVILGSGTFWEGINIEGESLSQVIIYKLPFPVPDPINEYKMSLSKDPIMEVAVPDMIIKLKQGAGRLIRSATDKGIVSILDPRVNSKSRATYRDITLNALPEKHITEDIAELQEFWNRINDKKEEVS